MNGLLAAILRHFSIRKRREMFDYLREDFTVYSWLGVDLVKWDHRKPLCWRRYRKSGAMSRLMTALRRFIWLRFGWLGRGGWGKDID